MTDVARVADLDSLLSMPGVVEELRLGSRLGVCALHGGGLESATDVVADEVAARVDASYYALVQPAGSRHHLSSTRFDPEVSPRLRSFLERIDTAVSIHGYGRFDDFRTVLLGGANRRLAHHVADHLRSSLPPEYVVVDDIDAIPRPLRGIHADNPVNRPANAGVQVELPPSIRWHEQYRNWSDTDDTPRAPQLDTLIDGLAAALADWAG